MADDKQDGLPKVFHAFDPEVHTLQPIFTINKLSDAPRFLMVKHIRAQGKPIGADYCPICEEEAKRKPIGADAQVLEEGKAMLLMGRKNISAGVEDPILKAKLDGMEAGYSLRISQEQEQEERRIFGEKRERRLGGGVKAFADLAAAVGIPSSGKSSLTMRMIEEAARSVAAHHASLPGTPQLPTVPIQMPPGYPQVGPQNPPMGGKKNPPVLPPPASAAGQGPCSSGCSSGCSLKHAVEMTTWVGVPDIDVDPKPPVCECGAKKAHNAERGSPLHSSWCPESKP